MTVLDSAFDLAGADEEGPHHRSVAGSGARVLLDGRGALLVFPAQHASAELVHFAVRYSSGLIHAVMPSARLDDLRIPDQPVLDSERSDVPFTVSVDAVGVGTGISAADRALTLRTLAAGDATPAAFRRPGHVMPVRVRAFSPAQSVWEIAVASVVEMGCRPVAAASRLVNLDGETLDDPEARAFARRHSLITSTPD